MAKAVLSVCSCNIKSKVHLYKYIDFDHSGRVATLNVRHDTVYKYVNYTGLIHSSHSISVNLTQCKLSCHQKCGTICAINFGLAIKAQSNNKVNICTVRPDRLADNCNKCYKSHCVVI